MKWIILSCLLLFTLCWAQQSSVQPGLVSDSNQFIGKCSNEDSDPQFCSPEDRGLRCKVLFDNPNSSIGNNTSLGNNGVIALNYENGILFLKFSPIFNQFIPIANYPSECADLVVLGNWNGKVYFTSLANETDSDEVEDDSCRTLGLGSIDWSDIINNTDNINCLPQSGTIKNVEATPNLSLFNYVSDNVLFDEETGWVFLFGVTTPTSEVKVPLVILFLGNASNPFARILYTITQDLNISAKDAKLFRKDGELYLVAPVTGNGTQPDFFFDLQENQGKSVRLFKVSDLLDAGIAEVEPLSSVGLANADKIAISEDGNALFISAQQLIGNNTGMVELNDKLYLVRFEGESLSVVRSLSYQNMLQAAGLNQNISNNQPNITALFANEKYLWIGWSNGELFVWNIESPFNLELVGWADTTFETLRFNQTSIPANKYKGINDICGSEKLINRAFVTVSYPGNLGDALLGFKIIGGAEGPIETIPSTSPETTSPETGIETSIERTVVTSSGVTTAAETGASTATVGETVTVA